jgi:DNA (cytosine-5)-methyltransferase 1
VCLALNELGYSVDPFILDAANFVPQSRQRLFVVGIRDDETQNVEAHETSHFYQSDIRPAALADFILRHPNIQWQIRELPSPPAKKSTLADFLEEIAPDDGLWWSYERAQYLFDQMSAKHQSVAKKMMGLRKWSYGTVFRRVRNGKSMAELRTDGVAGCLRTPRGGSGRQILFKAGYRQFHVRLLTPRECAALMGVPDFEIEVPSNQALFGFGDAVCVPVIEWIATHYLNPLVNERLRNDANGRTS